MIGGIKGTDSVYDWVNNPSNRNATFRDLIDELNNAGLINQNESGVRGKYGDGTLGRILNTVEGIENSLIRADRALMDMIRPWREADAAAAKYAKTIGSTVEGLKALRRESIRNVVRGNIGSEFGMNAADLIEAQTNYMKGIGRNVKLGLSDQRTMAAITSVFGDSTDMFNAFDKIGVSMEGVGTHMGKMYSEAAKSGISLERYANNVKQGLEMANRYTFKDGLRGMEAMAKRAAAIRMDMAQVQSFAGSFDTIENALSNTAKLQVLGGQFAAGADALGLLNDSLNDLESLQKRMEGFTATMGTFNKATGEVDISAFNRMRIREYAKITGQDAGKVEEVAKRQAMRGEIESQLARARNFASLDEDMRELIKNSATFQNGKAGVTIDGEFKEIEKLSNKDRQDLIAESRTQGEDIKDIAKHVRSLDEMRTGIRKQYEGVSAQLSQVTGIGSATKGITQFFAHSRWFINNILRIVGVLALAKGGLKIFDSLAGIGRSIFRGGEGSVSSSASRIGRAARIARPARVPNIPAGGKQIVSAAGKQYTQVGTRVFNSAGKEVFGAAKTAITNGATAAGKASIARRGAGRALQRTAIKLGGKTGGRLIAGLGTGLAKGGAVGLIGTLGDIGTDMMVESGKVKEGGAAHATMKVGSRAAEGFGTGALIGGIIGSVVPVIGNAAGAAVGGAVGAAVGALSGAMKIDKINNGKILDSQLKNLGIERKGDYGAGKLNAIDKALQTGKMSNALRKKLLKEGDVDIVNQINAVKDEKKKARESRIEKRRERAEKRKQEIKERIGTAKFEIETAYFAGKGIRGDRSSNISPVRVLRGRREDGSSETLNTFKRLRSRNVQTTAGTTQIEHKPMDVNVNGTIELKVPNGQSFDIMAEIKKNPKLLTELTQAIIKNMNTQQYGTYREDRAFGNNPVR